jgi:hypothetical protein
MKNVFPTEFVTIFMTCLHTVFHILSSRVLFILLLNWKPSIEFCAPSIAFTFYKKLVLAVDACLSEIGYH